MPAERLAVSASAQSIVYLGWFARKQEGLDKLGRGTTLLEGERRRERTGSERRSGFFNMAGDCGGVGEEFLAAVALSTSRPTKKSALKKTHS